MRDAERLGHVSGATIDEPEQLVDELQAEIDVDPLLPRPPDAAVPKAPRFFGCVVLLEPRLPHDEHAIGMR